MEKLTVVQQEYLRNAQRAIKVADSVKFNRVAYEYQSKSAQGYWAMFLKSSANPRFQDNVNRMRDLLNSGNVTEALTLTSI